MIKLIVVASKSVPLKRQGLRGKGMRGTKVRRRNGNNRKKWRDQKKGKNEVKKKEDVRSDVKKREGLYSSSVTATS